jgi:hypothetical protein
MVRPGLLKSREPSAAPIARYLTVVGSALVVLLLIAGWSLLELPASSPDRPEIIEGTTIRIRSEHKWPEKVVRDTNQPTFSPLSIEVAPAQQSVEPLPEEMTDQSGVDGLAKPNPDARPINAHRPPARAKRKPVRAVRFAHVARTRHRNEQSTLGTDEECCWPGWPDRRAMSKPASRKRVARQDSWIGWRFPEAN